MPRESRPTVAARACRFGLAAATLAASMLAQADPPTPARDAEAENRTAVLHALFLLRLAPYLTLEPPPPKPQPSPSPSPPRPQPQPAKDQEEDRERQKNKESLKPYRIGLVGADPVVQVAKHQLTGKKVNDAPIVTLAVPVEEAVTAKAAGSYDLLYIAESVDTEKRRQILASHAKRPVPLVCVRPGFAAMGGSVQLFVLDNCVRFEANAEALKKQGLRVDSQLLKLSKEAPR